VVLWAPVRMDAASSSRHIRKKLGLVKSSEKVSEI
jgi:hypothetical protein